MDNIIKYVRNRNPLNPNETMSMSYSNLEDESGNIQAKQMPRSYSSTADFKTVSEDTIEIGGRRGTQNDQETSTDQVAESVKYYTVDQAVEKIGFGLFQFKLSMLTGLAWMADAMEMMILSILAPALHCDWLLNEWQKALITTVVFCGMMLSGAVWGKLCDMYGRKTVIELYLYLF